jgi:L-lactate dehydrogenase complex protein LldG
MSNLTARDEILRAVRSALPPAVSAPSARELGTNELPDRSALVERFTELATSAGSLVLTTTNGDVSQHADAILGGAREVLSLVPGVQSTIAAPTDPHGLATLELFVCEASLAVAENAAMWIATRDRIRRAGLFLAERVVIVVAAETIVADLHEAYARINVRSTPFGTFVSGPSKTADIEQALVIGAHGPKELVVIITGA